MTWEQVHRMPYKQVQPQRVMTLEEVANLAAIMASGKASGMTGTLTMGAAWMTNG